jgi:EAL domain-containing protein (putative c-di-GMP-specific phosphodiesterase class I)
MAQKRLERGRRSRHQAVQRSSHADGSPHAVGTRPSAMIEHVLELTRRHLDMDVAFVGHFSGGNEVVRSIVERKGSGVPATTSVPLEDTYCKRMTDGRIDCVIPDAASDPRVSELPATRTANIGAYIGVPIVLSDGTLYGTFCCTSSGPRPELGQRDVQLMKVLADLVADQIEHEEREAERARQARREIAALADPGSLHIVFQPISDLWSGTVVGFEALARFHREPRRGPDQWFQEAWRVGLGETVEMEAVRAALRHLERIPKGCYLSFNLSPETVLHEELEEALSAVEPSRVVLEITEHAEVDDYDALLSRLADLRARGLRVAVDDAGAGYASLRHILRLAPDIIKLDISLTKQVHEEQRLLALTSALISFASRIGASVTAEGVEADSEAAALRALGVGYAQGYLIGRPGVLPGDGPPADDHPHRDLQAHSA